MCWCAEVCMCSVFCAEGVNGLSGVCEDMRGVCE